MDKAQRTLIVCVMGLKFINGTLYIAGTASSMSISFDLTFTDGVAHLCIKLYTLKFVERSCHST